MNCPHCHRAMRITESRSMILFGVPVTKRTRVCLSQHRQTTIELCIGMPTSRPIKKRFIEKVADIGPVRNVIIEDLIKRMKAEKE